MALFGLFGGNKQDGKGFDKSQAGAIIRYTHLPGIFPRIRALGGKFGHFAFLLALIYRSARLLPAGHPMLNPVNIGRFGVRDVIATAANGLVVRRENLDQIIVFGAVIMALVMILIQAALIGLYAFMGSAEAATGTSFFTTPSPDTDLAFQFLRQVFGVDKIFGTATVVPQAGFHAILGFYSTAMMIVAVIIVVYYVITIVGESAQTGTPFGKRFNGLWAPIRLVLALGLLVPLGGGLNTAQYLTLYIAKFGSSLATNGWVEFSKTFDAYEQTGKVGTPSAQALGELVFAAEACTALYNKVNPTRPVTAVAEIGGTRSFPAAFGPADVMNVSKGASLRYVWTTEQWGGKINDPTCGSITMEVFGPNTTGTDYDKALADMYVKYQDVYLEALGGMRTAMSEPANEFAKKYAITNGLDSDERAKIKLEDIAKDVAAAVNKAQTDINGIQNTSGSESTITSSYTDAVVQNLKTDARQKGWASAGAYYLEIAKVNQAIFQAVGRSFPVPTEAGTGGQSAAVTDGGWFSVSSWIRFLNKTPMEAITINEKEVRTGLGNVGEVLRLASGKITTQPLNFRSDPVPQTFSSQFSMRRPVLVLTQLLFGDALLRLMDNQVPASNGSQSTTTMNPMALLIQAGSDILDKSEIMLYAWIGAQVGSGSKIGMAVGTAGAFALGALSGGMASGFAAGAMALVGSFAPAVLMFFLLLGLVAGIMLFYVLPLLPFMYFFFSVVNWVIEVAESFVAAPLFALAHLRIEGDGLPGQTAYAGWLTLFGVMLRPILIIIGLIVATVIFGAAYYFLTFTFKQAVFSYRGNGVIDFTNIGTFGVLAYLLLFVYMVYILANSTFKLIDTIPDKAMRWIGGQQPFTGDRPIDIGNMQSMAIAGYGAVTQAKDAIGGEGGAVAGVKRAVGSLKGKGGGSTPSSSS